ncbi:MAG: slipin family protein [Candidatus Diapherotrites archaeon]|jgi:regulator of protease activity HflC (stomatin/prohibitin superfamily)|uniref:Slipin family protein n=1 Tax=Candidatus Iainarchaeum sp. TaxID=3101447 RepID=A0A8T5GF48_9ARCH|nr:slipin family protein [Candidatus Diapherotrites archaeon]MBT7241677.1 slipin family protein [Candidatus Diapherotrites archaeon]
MADAFTLLLGAILVFIPIIIIVLIVLALSAIKIVTEYERGIKFTLGRYSGIMGPGLNFVIPILQSYRKLDIRIKTVDIPKQEVMTKDNVPVRVNAVVYFEVKDPEKAVLNIQDYTYAVAQYAQTALRDIIGNKSLDEVLSRRDEIASEIELVVDKETDPWGLNVTGIKMQDVELPENLKRTMAKQAEAERERRGTVIKALGEVEASDNLAKAAKTLAASPGALHLRTLNTLNDLSSDQSNTVIFAMPLEVLRAFEAVGKMDELIGKPKKKKHPLKR